MDLERLAGVRTEAGDPAHPAIRELAQNEQRAEELKARELAEKCVEVVGSKAVPVVRAAWEDGYILAPSELWTSLRLMGTHQAGPGWRDIVGILRNAGSLGEEREVGGPWASIDETRACLKFFSDLVGQEGIASPMQESRTRRMPREEAHQKALAYIGKHGWPSSARKLAGEARVSRPLLNDLPGIERYKKPRRPKAAGGEERRSAGEHIDTCGDADHENQLAFEEQKALILSDLTSDHQERFKKLNMDVQKAIVRGWDSEKKENSLQLLRLVFEQGSDDKAAKRSPSTRQRETV